MDYYDIVQRAGWTGAEVTLAVLITELADVNTWWAAPLALTLAAAKTWVVNRRKAVRDA